MLKVECDATVCWDADQDWQKLSEAAISAAFSVTPYAALAHTQWPVSVSLSLAANDDIQALNSRWRGQDKPTNVLSFPMMDTAALGRLAEDEVAAGGTWPGEILLGDVILAHGVCAGEAQEKGISLPQHTAHLIIHGALHLLGYDHIDEASGDAMEALEVKALASLGLSNPYIG